MSMTPEEKAEAAKAKREAAAKTTWREAVAAESAAREAWEAARKAAREAREAWEEAYRDGFRDAKAEAVAKELDELKAHCVVGGRPHEGLVCVPEAFAVRAAAVEKAARELISWIREEERFEGNVETVKRVNLLAVALARTRRGSRTAGDGPTPSRMGRSARSSPTRARSS
jgi:murein L,D-transpeptidase YcbB/YkuD